MMIPPAVSVHPRRPYDDDQPDGYLESDLDFVRNNFDAAVALLEWWLETREEILSILERKHWSKYRVDELAPWTGGRLAKRLVEKCQMSKHYIFEGLR